MSDLSIRIEEEIGQDSKKNKNELMVKVVWAFASFALFFSLVTVIWMCDSMLPDGFWFDLIFG